jgi:hypothetical protein
VKPGVFVDIDVEFESAVMKLSNGHFLYTYAWRNRTSEDIPKDKQTTTIAVDFADDFIKQAFAHSGDTTHIAELASTRQGVVANTPSPPVFRVVAMNFHLSGDAEKRTLGTAKVSILRPK